MPILCLHPSGSKLNPRGAAKTLDIPLGGPEPKRIKLAVSSKALPKRVGLDWSYAWEIQEARLLRGKGICLALHACDVAADFGSIVSYDPIPAGSLRVRFRMV